MSAGWLESVQVTCEYTTHVEWGNPLREPGGAGPPSPFAFLAPRYVFQWVDAEGWSCRSEWFPRVHRHTLIRMFARGQHPDHPGHVLHACYLMPDPARIELVVRDGEIVAELVRGDLRVGVPVAEKLWTIT